MDVISPRESAEDRKIVPSPRKPYETAETGPPVNLVNCSICNRHFADHNLPRHLVICQKLAEKPKRAAFNAIAQRLSHVAQEAAVRPVIQNAIHEPPVVHKKEKEKSAPSPRVVEIQKENKEPKAKKRSPNRTGHVGSDLFGERQKELKKCPSCERTFVERTFDRHVEFCKQQQAVKDRQPVKGEKLAQTDLLMRRVNYRPPVLKLSGKKSAQKPPLPHKASSSTTSIANSDQTPIRTKMPGSKSALGSFEADRPLPTSDSGSKTPQRLTNGKLKQHSTSSLASSSNDARERDSGQEQQVVRRRIMESAGDSSKVSKPIETKPLRQTPKQNPAPAETVQHHQRPAAIVERPPAPRPVIEPSGYSDPFLIPAVHRVPIGALDKQRMFERIGGTYRVKQVGGPPTDIQQFLKSPTSQSDSHRAFDRRSTITLSSMEGSVADSGFSTYRAGYGDLDDDRCEKCHKSFPIPEAMYCCYCGNERSASNASVSVSSRGGSERRMHGLVAPHRT